MSERLIGVHGYGERGAPTLVVCGGLHGNEPSGAEAAEQVLAALREGNVALRGRVVFLRGNVSALASGVRYADIDLNRVWTDDRVEILRGGGTTGQGAEDLEQAELLRELDRAASASTGPVTILDLHTTSSDGPPFAIFSDTLPNRRLVLALGVPAVLGLEERVDGTLLDFATREGHTAFVVEGGQHDDAHSRDNHAATIWLTMVSTGVAKRTAVPDLARHRATLRAAVGDAPVVCVVRHRHHVDDARLFELTRHWRGFERIDAGEIVAHDDGRPVPAPESGHILMPLRQDIGHDGFFVVRAVRPFWLKVSSWVRRLGIPRVLPLLPGVARSAGEPGVIEVDPRVARLYSVELFHLAGYRRRGRRGRTILFASRQDRRSA